MAMLPEIEIDNGDKDEDVIFEMSTKMYRYDEPTGTWARRGNGNVRFLQHNLTKEVRVHLRTEKNHKLTGSRIVIANHPLTTNLDLKMRPGSDRELTYFTPDWSEDPETGVVEQRNELFAFRFTDFEEAKKFKETFEKCQKGNFTGLEIIRPDSGLANLDTEEGRRAFRQQAAGDRMMVGKSGEQKGPADVAVRQKCNNEDLEAPSLSGISLSNQNRSATEYEERMHKPVESLLDAANSVGGLVQEQGAYVKKAFDAHLQENVAIKHPHGLQVAADEELQPDKNETSDRILIGPASGLANLDTEQGRRAFRQQAAGDRMMVGKPGEQKGPADVAVRQKYNNETLERESAVAPSLSGISLSNQNRSAAEYEERMHKPVESLLDAANTVGGLVQEQGAYVKKAFDAQRKLLSALADCSLPEHNDIPSLLEDTTNALASVAKIHEEASPLLRKHTAMIASTINAFRWVEYNDPQKYIREILKAVPEHRRKILEEQGGDKHATLVNSIDDLLRGLQEYVAVNHPHGLRAAADEPLRLDITGVHGASRSKPTGWSQMKEVVDMGALAGQLGDGFSRLINFACAKTPKPREMETIRILLLGNSGVGKSSLGNFLLKASEDGHFQTSCEKDACTMDCKEVKGHFLNESNFPIAVIDAPGFNDPRRLDEQHFNKIRHFLNTNKIHCIAVVIDSGSPRWDHSLLQLISMATLAVKSGGDGSLGRLAIIFSKFDVGSSSERSRLKSQEKSLRESDPEALQQLKSNKIGYDSRDIIKIRLKKYLSDLIQGFPPHEIDNLAMNQAFFLNAMYRTSYCDPELEISEPEDTVCGAADTNDGHAGDAPQLTSSVAAEGQRRSREERDCESVDVKLSRELFAEFGEWLKCLDTPKNLTLPENITFTDNGHVEALKATLLKERMEDARKRKELEEEEEKRRAKLAAEAAELAAEKMELDRQNKKLEQEEMERRAKLEAEAEAALKAQKMEHDRKMKKLEQEEKERRAKMEKEAETAVSEKKMELDRKIQKLEQEEKEQRAKLAAEAESAMKAQKMEIERRMKKLEQEEKERRAKLAAEAQAALPDHRFSLLASKIYLDKEQFQNEMEHFNFQVLHCHFHTAATPGPTYAIVRMGNVLCLVFRGTDVKKLSDLVCNLNIATSEKKLSNAKLLRMHAGFMSVLDSSAARGKSWASKIHDQLLDSIDKDCLRVVYAGHSLGGALAHACRALHTDCDHLNSAARRAKMETITFGAPLVFMKESDEKILEQLHNTSRNYILRTDVVPRLLRFKIDTGVTPNSLYDFMRRGADHFFDPREQVAKASLGIGVGGAGIATVAAASGAVELSTAVIGACCGFAVGAAAFFIVGGIYVYASNRAAGILLNSCSSFLVNAKNFLPVGHTLRLGVLEEDLSRIPTGPIEGILDNHRVLDYHSEISPPPVPKKILDKP